MANGSRIVHPNALPNYQNAIIQREKLERYVLDSTNPVGKNKATVFKSALGFDQSNWQLLEKAILNELPYHEAILGESDIYGQRYNVTFSITGPNGRTASVLTAWIIDRGNDFARFVTAIVQ